MKAAWILATILALSFSPAFASAREKAHKTGKSHTEQRSAKSSNSAGKRHSKAVSRSSKKQSHRSSKTHRSSKRTVRSQRSHVTRHDSRVKRTSRKVHRAPRYHRVRRSVHLHPSFLPRYRHGYFWSAGYYYPRYYFDVHAYPRHASLRIQAHPSEAEVYVDGYYAGIVDDFDGFFQRLRVAPGTHEITLRLEGYRTWSAEIYASPHHTVKVHCDLIPGAALEADMYDDY